MSLYTSGRMFPVGGGSASEVSVDATPANYTPTSPDCEGHLEGVDAALGAIVGGSVPDNTITNAKLSDMATARLKGRATAGTGDPEDLQISALTEETTPAAGVWLLGETAAGALCKVDVGDLPAGSVAADSITNTELANMATARLKGRATAGTGDPEDLQISTLSALASPTTGDSLVAERAGALGHVDVGDLPGTVHAGSTSNPHGVTAAQAGADPSGTAASAVSTHEAAGDPHPGYVLESREGAANGVATLDGSTKVPTAQIPSVTNAMLADVATSTIKGRVTAAAGDVEDLTAAQARTVIGVYQMVEISQTAYDALGTPDASTLYLITS